MKPSKWGRAKSVEKSVAELSKVEQRKVGKTTAEQSIVEKRKEEKSLVEQSKAVAKVSL